jgi:hypothetical protein
MEMNHQDFVLPARTFPDAFTGRYIKRLRTSLGFIFGNYAVYVLQCRIAVR